MYCRAIACDFDGTGATDGHPAPELYAALAAARSNGIVTLLVTGRVLEDVQRACEELSPFDAVVAENGAVIHLCGRGRTIRIGQPPSEHFLGELRAQGVPFHTGAVIIGTWEQHAHKVFDLVRRFGIDAQVIFNRAAVMVLPSGINKAVGVRRALEELGRSEHNLIAFGDAENDIPLLLGAEIGVAARGAVDSVRALVDDFVSQPGGAGVALHIQRILEAGAIVATPKRHSILLGTTESGAEVTVPALGTSLLISGDPRSGKSWIAGLLSEQLIEDGYRVCIIDPEGDYTRMEQRPNVITFGHDLQLPSASALARLLASTPVSTVLSLSSLTPADQLDYVGHLLTAIHDVRQVTGCPHWLVIDEAHYFFQPNSELLQHVAAKSGSICLVTYRPSLLANEVFEAIGGQIVTTTKVEEERYLMTEIFQARDHGKISAHDALTGLEPPRAGLLRTNESKTHWSVFTPLNRITRHAHHARKYADTRLAEEKAFHFVDAGMPLIAYNMLEFHEAIRTAPMASLRHHLRAGDFSRWVGEVIGDQQLARGLRKVERSTPAAANPDRAEILAHIEDHYLIETKETS
jgi:hydroxymethylpyrimidine pyrophosphatase-like HAD family hydrolase